MLSFILGMIALFFIVMVISFLLKQYVFPKFKVNKWIILGIAIVAFLVPLFLQLNGQKLDSKFAFLQAAVIALLFIWFLDSSGWGPKAAQPKAKKPKYSAPAVIKSKAKPNRLKNSNMEVIDIKDIKKKTKKKK